MNHTARPPEPLPTLDDVRAAAARIEGSIARTPFLQSRTLSKVLGATVWLKFENLQFTASFKERGALNKLLTLSADERSRGVIAASAGNHAQGVAYHAARTGVAATIVMPLTTPNVKVERVREHGARVILHGATFAEAAAEMHRRAEAEGLTVVHPFDDPAVIAGQGTATLEMLEAEPAIDTLAIPIGGGGLIAGAALVARALKPDIRIVGVQSAIFPGMARAAGQFDGAAASGSSVAEGIAVSDPGQITRRIVASHVDHIAVVGEDAIEEAVALLLGVEKTLCEGAGAAGIAAMTARPELFAGRTVGVILSGGNIDTRVLVTVLQRHLTRVGRMVRIRAELPDNPGSLARLTTIVAAHGGNIYELRHERFAATSRAKESAVSVDIELRDPADLGLMMQDMTAENFLVRREEF
ncbi:threonine dehydratase [Pseudoxanthobacter soli DSM 19599]|uniref:Threonine dehydratase n=1 Tax=Pseudoxanthobacter soli DSM 19599 TaxID=1123029 RepID=A0A1M7ZR61_9HYPH|nr:threonine ammonia-lyase [Pseudoxanthobacter soli]SHO67375.1 threonine dehydratase [Pseudoxanthobacter soli DSM 19599]